MVVSNTVRPGSAAQATSQLELFLNTISSPDYSLSPPLPAPENQAYISNWKGVNLSASHKKAVLVRDSQASRLKPGKTGSRRRRRHDNDTFADHPLVKSLDPTTSSLFTKQDLIPGPFIPRTPSVFVTLPKPLRAQMRNADVLDSTFVGTASANNNSYVAGGCVCTRSVGAARLIKKCDRGVCGKTLKKWGVERAKDVSELEGEIVLFFREKLNSSWRGRLVSDGDGRRDGFWDIRDGKDDEDVSRVVVGSAVSSFDSWSSHNSESVVDDEEENSNGGEVVDEDDDDEVIVVVNELLLPPMDNNDWVAVQQYSEAETNVTSSAAAIPGSSKFKKNNSSIKLQNFYFGSRWVSRYMTTNFSVSKTAEEGWCQVVAINAGSNDTKAYFADTMSLVIRDNFLRVIVHMMARYLGLSAESE
ncbi:hypothetical protein HK100_004995 [Physocladia obscura]|uniref:Uncharacterized protein n=1 Tax=Physocladia obscura TaxID=109957 RepID=A0AAD5SS97_9FUNG|nr:hypothetical protein HK100_004995 [Physocladia obscura]